MLFGLLWGVAIGTFPSFSQASNPPPTIQNTLVTGVVINQDERLILQELKVRIYRHGVQISEITTQHGMFSVDLEEWATPRDRIEVVIQREGASSYHPHGGKIIRTTLASAQNLNMQIQYDFPRIDSREEVYYFNGI